MGPFSKIFKRQRNENGDHHKKEMQQKNEDSKLPEIDRTEFYFSYGSNMLPSHLKKCKDIQPYSIRRGIIRGWRLSFSCAILSNKSDPSFANIVPHEINQEKCNKEEVIPYVNGCIIELNPQCFDRLDGYEFTYIRTQFEAEIYKEDGGGTINVWTYIMDKKHEMYLNKKYPLQKYEFIEIPPSKNYLDILIEGAKSIGLYHKYIDYMKAQCFQNYLKLQPQDKILQTINGTIFTMKDVGNWNNDKYKANKLKIDKNNRIKGPIMVFKGIVFDLHKSPKYFQQTYGGNDITLKQALRWVHASPKNTKSINTLENQQKLFINNVLEGALHGGSILGICVGKLSKKDKFGYHYYKW